MDAFASGGTTRTTYNTASALAAERYEVEIVSVYQRRTSPRCHAGCSSPEGDVDALGSALLELVNDPKRRARLGAAARRTAESYGRPAITQRWVELLEAVTSAAATRRSQGAGYT